MNCQVSIDQSVYVTENGYNNSSSQTCTAVRQKRERTQCDGKWPITGVHIRQFASQWMRTTCKKCKRPWLLYRYNGGSI